MTLLIGLLSFVVILGVLIFVHELGHFLFAKLMGVRVVEFGLGFPPRLLKLRWRGTLYSLNAIPLGGFVKMLGENGQDAEPDSFGAKPPWQRLVILLAGPTMNLGLAVSVLFFALMIGSPRSLPIVTRVEAGSPAQAAGLQSGDRIVAINGHRVTYADTLLATTNKHLGERLQLRVYRPPRFFSTSVVPRVNPPPDQGPIGIQLEQTVTVSYTPAKALKQSFQGLGAMIVAMPQVLQHVAQNGGRGVTGPIGIAHVTTDVVHKEPQQGVGSLLIFVALLSANLGVLNLLPIPALDGGRIFFVLISWIRRRNLDPELEGVIHMVGMALLLLLIAFVSYHDLLGWIIGHSS